MSLWLHGIVVDSHDPRSLAAFWADALDWLTSYETDDEVVIEAREDRPPALVFVAVMQPARNRSRVHLDLPSPSPGGQRAIVERLRAAGAPRADVGQGDAPWEVLRDPEGNEFCVLEPRAIYEGTGAIAAIVVTCADPVSLSSFWSALLGWPPGAVQGPDAVGLRAPDGTGLFLEFVRAAGAIEPGKNRVHLDLAPRAGDDQQREVERAIALGAIPADIGQGDVQWRVLRDPEGNEFCVLQPKEWAPR
jgi:predicted enzyme related to lactoylglutathione lyase